MAETKGNIKDADMKKGQNVESVTETVPHEADASSAPGPYKDLELNRPPVSTNRPDVPIAHSLIAGAGAPTGEPEIHPETYVAANAYVTSADKEHVEKMPEAPKAPGEK